MGLKVVLLNLFVHPATTYTPDPSYFYLHHTRLDLYDENRMQSFVSHVHYFHFCSI